MSIVRLICKKKILNVPTSRMQGKCKLSKNSIKMSYSIVLYTESSLDQYGLDLSKMGSLLY